MIAVTASGTRGANVDAVVVGAGFGGLYTLHRLRQLGFSVQAFEAAEGVGGTWYWNRYPGARCDVESLQYSYSFSPELDEEWHWTERYATQPEILRYLNHVADRFSLRPHIRFNTRVRAATFDERDQVWLIETQQGDRLRARFFILASGCLSVPRLPELPGIERFKGRILQTAKWPHDGVNFSGQRVGVVGTGSSGIQSIPVIARQAGQLVVFQRTPSFSVPARNGPIDPDYLRRFKANAAQLRVGARASFGGFAPTGEGDPPPALSVSAEERQRRYEQNWTRGGLEFMTTFIDLFFDRKANDTAVEFLHDKIRSTVTNPAVAERLLPRSYPAFAKRLCVDTDYFETYNRPNVTLVDIREHPILELTETGLRTDSAHYELDSLIFATGFDAVTGAALAIDIRGRSGISLCDHWSSGPRTYLGLAVAGFPNLFLVTGPGSPSVLSNMVLSIEQHVDWIANCLSFLRSNALHTIEATEAAESEWITHVASLGDATLFTQAHSWYVGANVPNKPRVFLAYFGGVGTYRQKCDEISSTHYTGFTCT